MVQCDKTKEDQMSWECGRYGGQEIGIRAFVVITQRQENTWKTWAEMGGKC